MKKIIFLISLFLIGLSQIFAYDINESFYYDEKVPNMYVTKIKGDNLRNGATYLLHRSDSSLVYCIDPFTREIDGTYQGYIGYNNLFDLTKEQINQMNLIAHYGYGYEGHTDIKWYGITQYLIWKSLNIDDIYFTDTYYGNRVEMYQNEVNEINDLIKKHYIVPKFDKTNYDFSIKESYTLTDKNKVLDLYDIEYDDDLIVSKKGNKLIISSEKAGTYKIKLIKKSQILNDYILYYHNTSQNMFYPGKYDDVSTTLTVTFYDGKIEVTKQDRETIISQGEATFKGAIYGLYQVSNDQLIDKIELNENGYGSFDHLSLKQYYIQEIEPSYGYQLDDTKYYINLTTNQNNISVNVFEDVIKNKIKIIKLYGNSITNNYLKESNVSFELYDIYDNYINTYITDENGEIFLELPFGSYILKQINGRENFTISEPIKLNISETSEDQEIVIKDNEEVKYGNLEIKKIGDDGNLLDGVKFNVFAKEDIVSLSGDIYYHKDELIDEIIINNGYGYLDNLYYGKYYLIEKEGADGYLLDQNPIEFNINDELTTLEVINKHYDIPNTGKNDNNYLKIISNYMIMCGIILGIYGFKKKYINH